MFVISNLFFELIVTIISPIILESLLDSLKLYISFL